MPVVVDGGTAYLEFLLDINQKSSAAKLSLDDVRIFLGETDNLTGYDPAAKTLASRASVFDLDAGGDVSVLLNARLNAGSGAGDMVLLVPDAAFANADPNSFVYLYSKMGNQRGATPNGGFEEWAVRSTGGGTVTPGTASVAGAVWLDNDRNGVRDASDGGLAGITVTLQGVDEYGRTVVLTTLTAEDGSYSFQNLNAGVYSVFETQPAGVEDGADFVGSLGGSLFGNDGIIDIHLGAGMIGQYYDFSEYVGGSNT